MTMTIKKIYKHKYATLMVKPETLIKLKAYALYKRMTLVDLMEEIATVFALQEKKK